MINEGGSVEIDGQGTLMACKSSILNKNRNPSLDQEEAEEIFKQYLGVRISFGLMGKLVLKLPTNILMDLQDLVTGTPL